MDYKEPSMKKFDQAFISVAILDDDLPISKCFIINDYLNLALIRSDTVIYTGSEVFKHCTRLLTTNDPSVLMKVRDARSIDELATLVPDKYVEGQLDPADEFWGHCSNLQAWAENDYDTGLLQSEIAFPLLKALVDEGDPVAVRVFRKEIVSRLKTNFLPTIEYLMNEDYLRYLNDGDRADLAIFFKDTLEYNPLVLYLYRNGYYTSIHHCNIQKIEEMFWSKVNQGIARLHDDLALQIAPIVESSSTIGNWARDDAGHWHNVEKVDTDKPYIKKNESWSLENIKAYVALFFERNIDPRAYSDILNLFFDSPRLFNINIYGDEIALIGHPVKVVSWWESLRKEEKLDFQGLAAFFSRFIPIIVNKEWPIYELMQKDIYVTSDMLILDDGYRYFQAEFADMIYNERANRHEWTKFHFFGRINPTKFPYLIHVLNPEVTKGMDLQTIVSNPSYFDKTDKVGYFIFDKDPFKQIKSYVISGTLPSESTVIDQKTENTPDDDTLS